jgi:hypothetical protein
VVLNVMAIKAEFCLDVMQCRNTKHIHLKKETELTSETLWVSLSLPLPVCVCVRACVCVCGGGYFTTDMV